MGYTVFMALGFGRGRGGGVREGRPDVARERGGQKPVMIPDGESRTPGRPRARARSPRVRDEGVKDRGKLLQASAGS